MRKFSRGLAFTTALLVGAGGVSACTEAESEPALHYGETDANDLLSKTPVTQIRPGETSFLRVIVKDKNPELYEALRKDLEKVDHQFQHGRTDLKAPELSRRPVRLDAHVFLGSDGEDEPYLYNDAACDTINVYIDDLDRSQAYIGAVALSQSDQDMAFVSWPINPNGSMSNEAYLCFFEDEEPAIGAVMFVDDQPR